MSGERRGEEGLPSIRISRQIDVRACPGDRLSPDGAAESPQRGGREDVGLTGRTLLQHLVAFKTAAQPAAGLQQRQPELARPVQRHPRLQLRPALAPRCRHGLRLAVPRLQHDEDGHRHLQLLSPARVRGRGQPRHREVGIAQEGVQRRQVAQSKETQTVQSA